MITGHTELQEVTPMSRKTKAPCVYILANQPRGTLYVGVTSDLPGRIWQHKEKIVDGFTKRYGLDILVWYEQHQRMESAIQREKSLKAWYRQWKINLIESTNPDWQDLSGQL